MIVQYTPTFERLFKKLHSNQKEAVRDAIDEIIANPEIGEAKQSDLAGVRVYKLIVINKLTLIAYELFEVTEINTLSKKKVTEKILTLLYLGSHENFYRDLKKTLK